MFCFFYSFLNLFTFFLHIRVCVDLHLIFYNNYHIKNIEITLEHTSINKSISLISERKFREATTFTVKDRDN